MTTARPIKRLFVAGLLWAGLALFLLLASLSSGIFHPAIVGGLVLRGGLGAYGLHRARALKRSSEATLGPARWVFLAAPIAVLLLAYFADAGEWMPLHSPALYTRDITPWIPEHRMGDQVLISSGSGLTPHVLGFYPTGLQGVAWIGVLLALVTGISVAAARRRRAG